MRTQTCSNTQDSNKTLVDLILFMGQSNMAGRGNAAEAPAILQGAGYEFKAISDPSKLYPIQEPFGVLENNPDGIDEPGMKTGSLVSAFVNAYYEQLQIPIVAVSASKGGSSINQWQPDGIFVNDVLTRLSKAKNFLQNHHYEIRHTFMVWCQGETDGDHNMDGFEYQTKLHALLDVMMNHGVEHCFLIRIGQHRDLPKQYNTIQNAQTQYCKTHGNATLISTSFDKMASLNLMKDQFHYYQDAYNIVGTEAGQNAARFRSLN